MPKRLLEQQVVERAQAMAHLGIWLLDPRTGEVIWSDEVYRLHGIAPGTPVTVDQILERVHPDDREGTQGVIERLERGEQIGRWANRIILGDGSVRWVEFSGGLNPDGTLVGFVQDGTERWEAQRHVEAQQARSELAESIAQLGSWLWDAAEGTMTWSPQLYRLFGLDPETFELTEQSAFARADPEDLGAGMAYLKRALRGEDPGLFEVQMTRTDGERRWFEARAQRFREGACVGVFQDVTERRAAADQLRLQAQILEVMNDPVVLARPDDRIIVWANPQAAAELRLTVDELVGRCAADFTAPGQDHILTDIRHRLATEGGWSGEIARLRADGTEVLTEARYTLLDHPVHGPTWVTVSHDIGERKGRERALHESEERLRAVQDNAPTGIATIDLDGHWLYINDALCTLLGRTRAELKQETIHAVIHPDEVEQSVQLGLDLREGRTTQTQGERRYIRPDGSTVWAIITVSLVRDPEGEPRFYVAHILDITDRKAEEDLRRRQAAELERANQAKTAFLSRMSHELRTPLNAVIGFGQLLADAELSAPDHGAVEQILYAGRHLLGLINEVLDITRVESGTLDLRLEAVDVADVIREAVDLVRTETSGPGITVTVTDPDPDRGDGAGAGNRFVFGDRRRIVQVLLNLLSNAIKYNHPGGVVAVSTEPGALGLRIAVADSGRGIPADAITRLFEPFDRLGIEGEGIEGTGIGLALARGLVHEMGGTITVRSEAGRGSTFTVELPTAVGPAPAAPGRHVRERRLSPARPDDSRAALRIVNIEDNPANQQLVESILRKRVGIELWTAADAVTGLELIRRHRPGLVILDLHLPDLPGDEVLLRLQAEPATPAPVVAVCSADANPAQIDQLCRMGADHYLTKPFDIPAFLAIVDTVAARGQAPAPADAL